MTTFSPNVTTENVEESNGTSTPEEEILDKNSQDVLVIPFGPIIGESVGLLSEQKVCIYSNIIDLLHAVYLYLFIFNKKLLLIIAYIRLYIVYF